eukprot:COSAG02_NODE_7850_length_2818_cov_3.303394_1_plen_101_part_00
MWVVGWWAEIGCSGMAAFAPIPCTPASKSEVLCVDWSSDPSAPLLAVSGRGSQIQVFSDEGDKMEPVRASCRACLLLCRCLPARRLPCCALCCALSVLRR